MPESSGPVVELLESRVNLSVGPIAAVVPLTTHSTNAALSQPRAVAAVIRSSTVLTNSIVGSASDGRTTIPYRLFVPSLDSPAQKVPLILFLHGRGDGGTDNVMQTFWMSNLQANTASGPNAAFVLAPQLRSGWQFGASGRKQTEGMTFTMIALRQAMQNPNVDTRRIYVVGVSMGAYGAWDFLRRYPSLFAAGVPMSYAGDLSTARTIANIPIWAFQGSADPIRPVKQMRRMIAALTAAGGHPNYTEIAGGGHYIWNPIFNDPALYAWLFTQQKA
jgi:predicted peptidase